MQLAAAAPAVAERLPASCHAYRDGREDSKRGAARESCPATVGYLPGEEHAHPFPGRAEFTCMAVVHGGRTGCYEGVARPRRTLSIGPPKKFRSGSNTRYKAKHPKRYVSLHGGACRRPSDPLLSANDTRVLTDHAQSAHQLLAVGDGPFPHRPIPEVEGEPAHSQVHWYRPRPVQDPDSGACLPKTAPIGRPSRGSCGRRC